MLATSIGAPSSPTRLRVGPLLVVGAATRDIDAEDARGWRLGGGVTYGAMAAARLGVRVRAVMGVDDDASRAPELALLRSAGVELELVLLRRGPVFELRPTPTARVLVARQASDRLPPDAVPAEWRASPAVLLAPVAGELGGEWSGLPSADAIVGLAWQGVFRRLLTDRPIEHLALQRGPLVERADVAVVSAEDAAAGSAPLAELLPRPDQQLAVTRGAMGAVHLQRLACAERRSVFSIRTVPTFAASAAPHPTGAGDVFLAAWLASLLAGAGGTAGRASWPALAVAAAAASLAAEAQRLGQLPGPSAVCRRLLRQPPGDDATG